MAFVNFMASSTGRIVRIIAGAVLIALGLFVISGTAGWIVAIVGIVLVAVGVLDVCLFAPLFGSPISGKAIRGEE